MDVNIIAHVRLLTGATELSDTQIWDIYLKNNRSINLTAANVLDIKATEAASLVDISESGSSRKMSDVHKNLLSMAKYFRDLAKSGQGEDITKPTKRPGRVNYIERR